MSDFTGSLIEEAPQVWSWGPPEKEKRLRDLLDAIVFLKDRSLHGVGVIGAYHMRSVAPLMAHVVPLYEMTADAQLTGTALT